VATSAERKSSHAINFIALPNIAVLPSQVVCPSVLPSVCNTDIIVAIKAGLHGVRQWKQSPT